MCHSCPPCATAVPQSQPQQPPQSQPQLSPSPSHNCPPCCDAIAATQQASQQASQVPHTTALPQPQPATQPAFHQARSPVPRQCRGHKIRGPKIPYKKSTHKKKSQKICTVKKIAVILHRFSKKWRAHSSGCSSVRLEYASGGRGVASSNLVIPTEVKRY